MFVVFAALLMNNVVDCLKNLTYGAGELYWSPANGTLFSVLTRDALRRFTFGRRGLGVKTLKFVKQQAIDMLLPDDDDLMRWLRSEPRSCAVVGNSGIVLGKALGAEIDSHDVKRCC